MSFADTIHTTLRPSRLLRVASALGHVTAVLVTLVLARSRPELVPVVVLVFVSAIQGERALAQRRPGVPIRLRWSDDHRLYWQDRAGHGHESICVEAKSWGALWVRLKVREPQRRLVRTLVIPFDAVGADVHRRLRARCRVIPPVRRA